MTKLPVQEIIANYDEDQSKLKSILQVLDIRTEDGKIWLTFNIAGDDHYVSVSVDEDDFNHAIKKAKVEESEDLENQGEA